MLVFWPSMASRTSVEAAFMCSLDSGLDERTPQYVASAYTIS